MSFFIASQVPLAPKTRRFLRLGQLGFGLLFLLIPLSILWLNPPQLGSKWVLLALLWLPLWLPLLGIVRGKAYTFAWANFIVMIYFLHSLTNLWVTSDTAFLLAVIEFIASCLMFTGCTYYAKYRGQELGLKIPKLKDDPVRQS
ncbi:MAG: DUF2069 domain-containing protein [Gammaproteobacteria bacterium]|jgi:uncharacterized membrane protein|nr:DUF2069 domain-containing protein [Gammaproteobacteria bacterium]MBU2181378.1 DUF2069 domain-containing protein [Gammaproteobacteria bacterium]MBU2427017.1 DUF2069 domain-containing protein [Gammaproteobacteria bacterium]